MTNELQQLQAAAPAAQSINAWYIVAAGAGATIVHAYHNIVTAGGLKNIWQKFWSGSQQSPDRKGVV